MIKGGCDESSVGILGERRSRRVLVAKLDDGAVNSAWAGTCPKLSSIAERMCHVPTCDPGGEMLRRRGLRRHCDASAQCCETRNEWPRSLRKKPIELLRP